jgi:ABC-type glutathione transport system ATPase component
MQETGRPWLFRVHLGYIVAAHTTGLRGSNGGAVADLKLVGVEKAFGSIRILQGIDLDIHDGEFVVFVGPSGCGKSTLLRCIAGLAEILGASCASAGRA